MSPILLVEDTEDDVFFLKRAFKKAGIEIPIQVAANGKIALEILEKAAAGPTAGLPPLILLDLKLPEIGGLAVLKWVRSQPQLAMVPVIVLTSSREIKDIQEAYALGANSYKVKPSSADELVSFAVALKGYWLEHDVASSSPRRATIP